MYSFDLETVPLEIYTNSENRVEVWFYNSAVIVLIFVFSLDSCDSWDHQTKKVTIITFTVASRSLLLV